MFATHRKEEPRLEVCVSAGVVRMTFAGTADNNGRMSIVYPVARQSFRQPGSSMPIEQVSTLRSELRRVPRDEASGNFAAHARISDRGEGRLGLGRKPLHYVRQCNACRDDWPTIRAGWLNSLFQSPQGAWRSLPGLRGKRLWSLNR